MTKEKQKPGLDLGLGIHSDKALMQALKDTCQGMYSKYEFEDFLQILRATIIRSLKQGQEISIPGLVLFKRRVYKGKPRKSHLTGGIFDPTSITVQAKISEGLKYAFKDRLTDDIKALQEETNPGFVPIKAEDPIYQPMSLRLRRQRLREVADKQRLQEVAEKQRSQEVVDKPDEQA